MYRRIVVPLDGSDLAEAAIPWAARLAVGAQLHLVHVLEDLPDYSLKMPDMDMEWEETGTRAAATYLDSQVAALEEQGLDDVVGSVVRGHDRAAEGLDRYCAENLVDLVVMTTHGESGFGRFWLGSVADELVRSTTVPVLLLRAEEGGAVAPVSEGFGEVLVPLDSSPEAEMAVEHGLALAEASGGRLVLLRVVAPGGGLRGFRADPAAAERPRLTEDAKHAALEYLRGVARQVRERAGPDVTVEVEVEGNQRPERGILERAENADVVVMATHGRSGFTRMVVGSVADKVLRGGTTPLLVMRAPGAEEE